MYSKKHIFYACLITFIITSVCASVGHNLYSSTNEDVLVRAKNIILDQYVDELSEEQIEKMASCIENENFDLATFGECHLKFHETMIVLADNPFLQDLYNKLHLHALQKIFFNPMTKEQMIFTHGEHKEILQFIKDKNPEGEQYIKMHLWKRRTL